MRAHTRGREGGPPPPRWALTQTRACRCWCSVRSGPTRWTRRWTLCSQRCWARTCTGAGTLTVLCARAAPPRVLNTCVPHPLELTACSGAAAAKGAGAARLVAVRKPALTIEEEEGDHPVGAGSSSARPPSDATDTTFGDDATEVLGEPLLVSPDEGLGGAAAVVASQQQQQVRRVFACAMTPDRSGAAWPSGLQPRLPGHSLCLLRSSRRNSSGRARRRTCWRSRAGCCGGLGCSAR